MKVVLIPQVSAYVDHTVRVSFPVQSGSTQVVSNDLSYVLNLEVPIHL